MLKIDQRATLKQETNNSSVNNGKGRARLKTSNFGLRKDGWKCHFKMKTILMA